MKTKHTAKYRNKRTTAPVPTPQVAVPIQPAIVSSVPVTQMVVMTKKRKIGPYDPRDQANTLYFSFKLYVPFATKTKLLVLSLSAK